MRVNHPVQFHRERTLWGLGALLLALWVAVPAAATTLAGSILDEAGQPLTRATLVLHGRESGVRQETTTDESGHFTYANLEAGRYVLLVLREGQIRWSFPLTLPASQEVLHVTIDVQKLRQQLEAARRLDPALERRREADRTERDHQEKVRSQFNHGVRALDENRPADALKEFQALQAQEGESGTLCDLLGSAYAASGDNQQAEKYYRRALELEPGGAAHHNNLGKLLVAEGHVDEGLAEFRRAAALDTNQAATYEFNQGAALLNANRPGEAVAPLGNAVRTDPTLAVGHFFLALALYQAHPPTGPEKESDAVRARMVDGFQRYLQLAPDGEFAGDARDYLEKLGAPPGDMLLPQVPSSEQELN